jgi:UDP-N-acetylmuramoylalanine--D-glutamate ligase
MRIAIVGYGKQGSSSYEYWQQGNELTICDADPHLVVPEGAASRLGPDYLQQLDEFDLIVRSPIIHPRDIVAANSPAIVEKVTSNTNEFFRVCPTKQIIGVTGTKGKGTTTTLIALMLEKAGRRVHVAGNIGTPPLELLKNDIRPDDIVVLELANFQLIDIHYSPAVAVCLVVSPEHQDWHTDLEEYYQAKARLFIHQKPSDIAIYYAPNDDSQAIAAHGEGRKLPYFAAPGAVIEDEVIRINGQTICPTPEVKLPGRHNLQNACAAATTVWQIAPEIAPIADVLRTFEGLPYRIEFRREVNGIRYYNDSFASAPLAPLAAIEAVPGKKVMILGGYDRGLDLSELADGIVRQQADIETLLLIGASGERLADSLRDSSYNNFTLSPAKDMVAVVKAATALAHSGEAVVLSPGFASFDMFKNFEDRGQQFNKAVDAL